MAENKLENLKSKNPEDQNEEDISTQENIISKIKTNIKKLEQQSKELENDILNIKNEIDDKQNNAFYKYHIDNIDIISDLINEYNNLFKIMQNTTDEELNKKNYLKFLLNKYKTDS